MTNYNLVIQGLMTHFFLPKALQHRKIYLCRGFFNPRDSKICKFIFRLNNIFEYLEQLPPFGKNQVLPEDEIIKIVEFVLPNEL